MSRRRTKFNTVIVVFILGILLLLSGCSGNNTTSKPKPVPNEPDVRFVEALIIAKDGGVIAFDNGIKLEIAARALAEDTKIKISILNTAERDKTTPKLFFEPSGLQFSEAALLTIPMTLKENATLRVFQQSTLNPMLEYGSEVSNWLPVAASIEAKTNSIFIELEHFSAVRAFETTDELAYLVIDIPAEFLKPGDILFTLTTYDPLQNVVGVNDLVKPEGPNWAPGHVGIFAPTQRANLNIIDSGTRDKVSRGNLGRFRSDSGHLYLGPRRPRGDISDTNRDAMVNAASGAIGSGYSFVGQSKFDFGDDNYSCVSLAEFALDAIGEGQFPDGEVSTPIELFNELEPVRKITVSVGQSIDIPVYGVVVDPKSLRVTFKPPKNIEQQPTLSPQSISPQLSIPGKPTPIFTYYCKDCQNTISAQVPDGATFTKIPSGYKFAWVPERKHAGKTFKVPLNMVATIDYTKPDKQSEYDFSSYNKTVNIEDALLIEVLDLSLLDVSLDGQGTVTSQPIGINCGNSCVESYPKTTTVNLTPIPALGWSFRRWAGDCTGTTCNLLMDEDKKVTAVFVPIDLPIDLPIDDACQMLTTSEQQAGEATFTIELINTISFIDPDGHLPFIFANPNINPIIKQALAEWIIKLTLSNTVFKLTTGQTFIPMTGSYKTVGSLCQLTAIGIGAAAGFPNAAVSITATIDPLTSLMIGSYNFGTNGVFPGGKPAVVNFEAKLK